MKARTRSRASRIWGVIASSCMAASGHLDRAAAPYAASSGRMRGDGGTDARGRERHPADRGGGRRHGGGAAAAPGDLATVDADGYANIVGRIKDMVIRGGENIYPREVEEFLYQHPAVSDVQV